MFPIVLLLAAGQTADPPAAPACANWAAECGPLDTAAPFLRTPRVELLPPCKGASTDGAKCAAGAWVRTFAAAAHFPFPRFNQTGEPAPTDGLVVYEGMKLTVDPVGGRYDLTFTATAPNVPVTVRLQLTFTPPPGRGDLQPIRLTLPPIVIEPSPEAAKSGSSGGTTVAVSHRGTSAAFSHAKMSELIFPNPQPFAAGLAGVVDATWTLTRAGTARFGLSAPTADDLSR